MIKRGEIIEDWQDEHHLILVNDPTDTQTFNLPLAHNNNTIPSFLYRGTKTPINAQLPRWSYKKANWGKIETRANELKKDIVTEGKNINNVVKIRYSTQAKESIPRGVRKDYKPY